MASVVVRPSATSSPSSHRAVGVIERQLFSAGNAEAIVPSAGVPIRARDHQAMQYREIDRSLDVEAEPSTDKQGTDHLSTSGLAPQPTEHKIRADADPSQLGKPAAIEARQHNHCPGRSAAHSPGRRHPSDHGPAATRSRLRLGRRVPHRWATVPRSVHQAVGGRIANENAAVARGGHGVPNAVSLENRDEADIMLGGRPAETAGEAASKVAAPAVAVVPARQTPSSIALKCRRSISHIVVLHSVLRRTS